MILRSVSLRLGLVLLPTLGCSGLTPPDLSPLARAIRVADCNGPAVSLDPSLAASLPARDGNMRPDDQWADLANQVPGGFAGILYVDGKPVLMLTDVSKSEAAKKALAPSFPGFDISRAEVRQARWNFAQLVDWYNYLAVRSAVWRTPGFTSGDKDEATNRISYGVVDAAARDSLLQKLSEMNLPCDLISVRITGSIIPL